MTTTINASHLLWPMSYPDRTFGRYAVSVPFSDIPADLHGHVTPKAPKKSTVEKYPYLADALLVRIIQPFAPRLTFTNGVDGLRGFAELQELAKTANIGPDQLFHELPATLIVKPVESIEAIRIGRPQAVKRLQIVAIRADVGEIRDNLDKLLNEGFGI